MEHFQRGRLVGREFGECGLKVERIVKMRGGCGSWYIEQEAGVRVRDSQLRESANDNASRDDGEVGG